jgi:hypothetical protein
MIDQWEFVWFGVGCSLFGFVMGLVAKMERWRRPARRHAWHCDCPDCDS